MQVNVPGDVWFDADGRIASGLYYNRNRFYSPELGRFLQRDPYESGLAILTALASNAESVQILLSGFDPRALYSGGMNLYEYAGSNPVNGRDPSGLEYDDFDAAIDDLDGWRVAALGYIQSASGYALIGLGATQEILAGILGISALQAAGNIVSDGGTIWDWLEAASVAAGPLGYAASRASRIGFSAFKWGRKMFEHSRSARVARDIALPILQRLCFAAGTLIVMADGLLKPIEQIEAGELVLCDFDPQLDNGPEVSVVSRTFRHSTTEIVDLCLEADGECFTITTTPEHPFWQPELQRFISAADLADNVRLTIGGTSDARLVGRLARAERVEVYNFEVAEAHTYYVAPAPGKEPILVHNACVKPGKAAWKKLANSADGKAKNLSTYQLSDRFHRIKKDAGIPNDMNTRVDDLTGDVFDWREKGETYGDVIGNIFHDF